MSLPNASLFSLCSVEVESKVSRLLWRHGRAWHGMALHAVPIPCSLMDVT